MKNFKKEVYKRTLANNEQHKKQAIAWYKKGHSPSIIAIWLGEPEAVVRNVYLKGVLKDARD